VTLYAGVVFHNKRVFLPFVEGSKALQIQFRIQCFLCREVSSIGLAYSDDVVSNNIQYMQMCREVSSIGLAYSDDVVSNSIQYMQMIRVLGSEDL
jgi:hypothetical protein